MAQLCRNIASLCYPLPMPDKPLWLQRIPSILADLDGFPAPVLDRFTIEQLFGVSRRQAVRLMHLFGGYQAGRTFLVHRSEIQHRLRTIDSSAKADQDRNQKRRIWRELTEHRSRVKAVAVPIPGVEHAPNLGLAGLPDGVWLQRHRLEISFSHPEELLQKLYLLSQALVEDYDRFADAHSQFPV